MYYIHDLKTWYKCWVSVKDFSVPIIARFFKNFIDFLSDEVYCGKANQGVVIVFTSVLLVSFSISHSNGKFLPFKCNIEKKVCQIFLRNGKPRC